MSPTAYLLQGATTRLVLGNALGTQLFKLLLEHGLTLSLLLGPASIDLLLSYLLSIQCINSCISSLWGVEVNEAKSLGPAIDSTGV